MLNGNMLYHIVDLPAKFQILTLHQILVCFTCDLLFAVLILLFLPFSLVSLHHIYYCCIGKNRFQIFSGSTDAIFGDCIPGNDVYFYLLTLPECLMIFVNIEETHSELS